MLLLFLELGNLFNVIFFILKVLNNVNIFSSILNDIKWDIYIMKPYNNQYFILVPGRYDLHGSLPGYSS